MGVDHDKKDKKDKKEVKVKTPLRKPKSLEQSSKTTVSDKQKRRQISKSSSTMSDKQKRKQTKTSSNQTTVTDTQKRGQVFPRYDLFEGTKEPSKEPKKKKVLPGSKGRKKSRDKGKKKSGTKFLPHIIKPLYILPEGEKKIPDRYKKKGVMA